MKNSVHIRTFPVAAQMHFDFGRRTQAGCTFQHFSFFIDAYQFIRCNKTFAHAGGGSKKGAVFQLYGDVSVICRNPSQLPHFMADIAKLLFDFLFVCVEPPDRILSVFLCNSAGNACLQKDNSQRSNLLYNFLGRLSSFFSGNLQYFDLDFPAEKKHAGKRGECDKIAQPVCTLCNRHSTMNLHCRMASHRKKKAKYRKRTGFRKKRY